MTGPDPDGPRVVSLVPSVTESLVAWGRPPIACTRFCEQPAIEAVGGTKRPRLARIAELRPDVVVMCDEENRVEDFDALVAEGLIVHVASPRRVEDVLDVLVALAEAVGAPRPERWVPPEPPEAGARAFVPIWRRPWMTIGPDTYGASVLRHAGWDGAWPDAVERYPEVTDEAVVAGRPAAVLAPTEPWRFTDADRPELEATFGCPAVVVDGQDLFWWGTRTEAAIDRLAAVLATVGAGRDPGPGYSGGSPT